jgi:hypothetical protein
MSILTPRRGRWLAAIFKGVIVSGAVAAATASADASEQTTPVVRPLPCGKLSPLPLCLPPEPTSTARCHDWTVERVRAVGGGPHLLVGAVCGVRTGERLQLRRHNPQGINPAILVLELVVQRGPFPDGPATREERILDVEPDAGYTTVTILPDGPSVPVDAPA